MFQVINRPVDIVCRDLKVPTVQRERRLSWCEDQ